MHLGQCLHCPGTYFSLVSYLWQGCHEGGTGGQASHNSRQLKEKEARGQAQNLPYREFEK